MSVRHWKMSLLPKGVHCREEDSCIKMNNFVGKGQRVVAVRKKKKNPFD